MKTQQHIESLIQQFNQPDTKLVISGYPESGKFAKNHGIAWYTKLTLEPIAKKYNQKFVVLAEMGQDNTPRLFAKGNILVLRIFDSSKLHLYPQVLHWLQKFSLSSDVYVHSEFGMRGGIWHFGFVLPFLGLIRLTGRKVTFFSHNVIDKIEMLSGHLNVKPHSLKAKFINMSLKFYYFGLAQISQKIIVLDDYLATRLGQFMPQSKIGVFPIPVKQHSKMPKSAAKAKLGIPAKQKVILFFGFVTWYKGSDWLIKSFAQLAKKNPDTQLVIAGGPSYSMATKPHYKKYYSELQNIARKHSNITIAGFVEENDIARYFSAADMVVFPYRGLMGASGCFSHALSYQVPFMMSQKMSGSLQNKEYQQIMADTNMSLDQVTFALSKDGINQIMNTVNDKKKLSQLKNLAEQFAKQRSVSKTARLEFEQLYSHTENRAKASYQIEAA